MPMKNPPHPGELLREECLAPLGLSIAKGASVLGVTRQALANLIHERRGISSEMAIRLEKAFGTSADLWLRMQTAYDLAQARKHEHEIAVTRYPMPNDIAA